MIKVSIIVPVYKTEEYLEKCLDSLVNQTLKDIEIIVVNDGSPDNSQEIIDRYIKKYPDMVKGVLKENGGLSDARNYGVKYATGEFIAFVDSDDYVELDTYEMAYEYAMDNDLDIVCFDRWDITNESRNKVNCNCNMADSKDKNYLLSEVSAWNRIIRAEIWNKNDFKFAKGLFYEDLELTPRFILFTEKIGFMNEAFYNYIIRDGSIMNQTKYNPKLRSIFTVMQNLKHSFENTKYFQEIEYLFIKHLLHDAMLRFLFFKEGKKDIVKISKVMRDNFPNWYKNKYFKCESWKYKTVCFLAYYKQISFLKRLIGK